MSVIKLGFYIFRQELPLNSKAQLLRPIRGRFVNASAVALLSFLYLLNLTQVSKELFFFLFPFQLCHWDRGSLRGWFSWSLSIQRRLFRDGRRCRICGGPPWPFTIHWPHEGTFFNFYQKYQYLTQNPMHVNNFEF